MKLLLLKFFVIFNFLELNVAEPKLKLSNIIFRHGDRTPTHSGMYSKDPYYNSTFFPYGIGALTNNGKVRIYQLGKSLRSRYKNFLGDIYWPDSLYARSTDNDRTKMSLQLVLAALYPPVKVQKWHDSLNWQPIPIIYVKKENDYILGAAYQSRALTERKRIEMKEDIQNRLLKLHDFMAELSNLTGENINNSLRIKSIYETLTAESYMNLTLPAWTEGMFPKGKMYDGVLLEYDIMTYDDDITRVLSGDFITKVTMDMLAVTNKTSQMKTKLFLYSAHEGNIVSILRSLNVYESHIPEYASAVIVELLEENDEYFVKILYYRGIPSELVELRMPGCAILCPLEKYLFIIKNILTYENNV